MSNPKRIAILGSLTLIAAVIIMFPARSAYNWFAPPDIQLSGISGSVWNGAATEGLAAGVYFRDLSWQLKPLSLLTGKLAFTTRFDPASGFMDADVAVAPGGAVILSNVAGTLPLDLLHNAVRQLRGISGNVTLNLDELLIENSSPVSVTGTIGITNLTAAALSRSPIGNFEAVLSSDADGINGAVKDVSGVLAVAGTLKISKQSEYSLIGTVATRPDTPDSILQQLRMLGSPDAQGNREFRIEGQL